MSERKKVEDFDIFHIDLSALEREWVHQPKLYFIYAEELAQARRELEESKANMEIVAAEVDKRVRKYPEKYGMEENVKLTEAMVKAAVKDSKKLKKAQEEFRAIQYKVNVAQAVVTALDHRKSALGKLVDLHGQNYFSKPTASEAGKEAMKKSIKQMSRSKTKKKKRRRNCGNN